MRSSHQSARIPPHRLPYHHILPTDLIHLRSIRPDLVGGAAATGGTARSAVLGLSWLSVAVESHDGAEGGPLEPTDEEFAEGGIGGVAAVEAADVGGPPRDTGEAHVEAGGELIAEAGPGGGLERMGVRRPY